MEGLGVAASVIAVQLTELTLKLAHKHMRLGPSRFDKTELQSISRALHAFNGMLQTLQTHLRINEEDEARLQTLNHLTEPLNVFHGEFHNFKIVLFIQFLMELAKNENREYLLSK